MNTARALKEPEIIKVDFEQPTETLRTARNVILQLRNENAELLKEINKLKHFQGLAYEDALSGLMNRRAFDKDIGQEIARANRNAEQIFSVLLIDLNDFKKINDTYGHEKGDDTIKWVARFLKTQVRMQDTVYRVGGDEFAVLLPDTHSRGARVVMNRMMEVLSLGNASRPFPVKMSIGASTFKNDGVTAHQLFDLADKRMYHSKKLQKQAQRRNAPLPF